MSAITFSTIATRFAWKEYRTLRGFWIAALVIAVLVELAALLLHSGVSQPRWAEFFFTIALAAAALYAVGVAATTFSMEHEEETYAYLTGLPTRWYPVFAGKLSFAISSSGAIAVALIICGWILGGGSLPGRDAALEALGVFGFAIVELIAWGTLFSLLLHHPLLAALLAIGAESLSLTLAVNTLVEGNLPTIALDSYVEVLPARLAIVACVFAINLLLARRWLAPDASRSTTNSQTARPPSPTEKTLVPAAHLAVPSFAGHTKTTRLRVFSHLLWQTWQTSWQLMFAAAAIALLLCSIPYLATVGVGFRSKEQWLAIAPFAIGLVISTLYASLVFAPDQHGRSYRFLAEHAAWPRYVWTARLVMWLTPALIVLAMGAASRYLGARSLAAVFRDIRSTSPYWDEHPQDIVYFAAALNFTSWGILLGIAVGQACSLFFRRTIVAGFAAVVISIPLLVWGFALWSWELPPAVFILPLVVGLFAATWLRIPDWIVDRNSLRAWLKVAAAVAIPLVFLGWRLPAARQLPVKNDRIALAQIANAFGVTPSLNGGTTPIDLSIVIANWVTHYESSATDDARTAGDRLIRLAEIIDWPPRPAQTRHDPEPTQADLDDYHRRFVELNRAIADEAVTLSRNRFVFPPLLDFDPKTEDPTNNRVSVLLNLLTDAGVTATDDGRLDDALEYHLAALRLAERISDRADPLCILPTVSGPPPC